jgi:hypothetical protein
MADLFYDCPGAWFGNVSFDGTDHGAITVDANNTLEALAFLRRRVTLTGVKPSQREPDGIVILFSKRTKAVVSQLPEKSVTLRKE